jgi:hypothetical protein
MDDDATVGEALALLQRETGSHGVGGMAEALGEGITH